MIIIVIITTIIIVIYEKPVHSSTSTQRGTEANRSHSRPAIVSKCQTLVIRKCKFDLPFVQVSKNEQPCRCNV